MATNHTEKYGLHLWEANDAFLRTEFNENSEKIEAAIRACFQPDNLPWVVGTYTQPKTEDVTVTLGFKPSLVLLSTRAPAIGITLGSTSIIVGDNPNYSGFNEVITTFICILRDDGFTITAGTQFLNDTKDSTTYYVAFR